MTTTFVNKEFVDKKVPGSNGLVIGILAQTFSSSFEGPNVLEKLACVNRSEVGGFTNFGVASYTADCHVGRFCNIGARVSIGGFEHPQDWLGITSYQWGKSAKGVVSEEIVSLLELNEAPPQKDTFIGSDVWIGDNAVIKRGVSIATGAIVGAGSVVTKDVPPFGIAVGVPSSIIRFRFSLAIRQQILETKWWERDLGELAKLPLQSVEDCLIQLARGPSESEG